MQTTKIDQVTISLEKYNKLVNDLKETTSLVDKLKSDKNFPVHYIEKENGKIIQDNFTFPDNNMYMYYARKSAQHELIKEREEIDELRKEYDKTTADLEDKYLDTIQGIEKDLDELRSRDEKYKSLLKKIEKEKSEISDRYKDLLQQHNILKIEHKNIKDRLTECQADLIEIQSRTLMQRIFNISAE